MRDFHWNTKLCWEKKIISETEKTKLFIDSTQVKNRKWSEARTYISSKIFWISSISMNISSLQNTNETRLNLLESFIRCDCQKNVFYSKEKLQQPWSDRSSFDMWQNNKKKDHRDNSIFQYFLTTFYWFRLPKQFFFSLSVAFSHSFIHSERICWAC